MNLIFINIICIVFIVTTSLWLILLHFREKLLTAKGCTVIQVIELEDRPFNPIIAVFERLFDCRQVIVAYHGLYDNEERITAFVKADFTTSGKTLHLRCYYIKRLYTFLMREPTFYDGDFSNIKASYFLLGFFLVLALVLASIALLINQLTF